MKEKAAEQIYRADGRNVFFEITTYGLSIDKVYINFVEYDKAAAEGQRMTGSIGKGGIPSFLVKKW